MDSLDEYLRTSYRPDREFRDGVLIERKGFDEPHSRLQAMLCGYIGERETNWNPIGYISLRVKIREGWYAVPDLCFYPRPAPEGRYPARLPLLWIEILSPEDRMTDVLARAGDLVANGVPYVWIIDRQRWRVNCGRRVGFSGWGRGLCASRIHRSRLCCER